MMKTNDWMLVGVSIGVGILVSYLVKNKKAATQKVAIPVPQKPNTEVINNTEVQQQETLEDTAVVRKPKEKPWFLSKGSKGKEVERLQIWLLRNHGWKGPVTGIYDEQTDRLVKKRFKQDHIDKATYEKYQMGIPIHELIKA